MFIDEAFFSVIPDLDPCVGETPAKRLLAAIIQDVFFVKWHVDGPMWSPRNLRQQCMSDAAWIHSNNTAVFSFLWTCEHLQLDPERIRDQYENGCAHFDKARLIYVGKTSPHVR